jgi:hypothetical protein
MVQTKPLLLALAIGLRLPQVYVKTYRTVGIRKVKKTKTYPPLLLYI